MSEDILDKVGYEDAVLFIKHCPITMLPSLLIIIVTECFRRKVYIDGGLLLTVERVIERLMERDNTRTREGESAPKRTGGG